MESVLNKGLKFAILPLRLDITQILTDFRRHERSIVWKKFWHGKENYMKYKPPMFKQKIHNFPQKNIKHQKVSMIIQLQCSQTLWIPRTEIK